MSAILPDTEQERTPKYRGISYTTPIDAAKQAVSVMDLAERLADKLRRSGNTFTTNCLLPDHEDKTPSFVIYANSNSWYCHGCLHGGDVVDLARLAWGYDECDVGVAAAYLLMEFGFDVPSRPASWHRKQKRQRPTRDAVEETKKNIVRRRLFKYLILPEINAIEDEGEREEELRRSWADFQELMR